jgi:hypothetical protein
MMLAAKAIVNAFLLFMVPVSTNFPWQVVKEPTETASVELDHAAPHSGSVSARLTVTKSEGHEIGLLQPFRAEGWRGRRVLLTGWVRTDLAGGEAGLAIITNNAGRNNIYYPSDQRLTKQTSWQKLSVVCDVPIGASLLSIGVWVRHGSGSVWLDDVTFGLADASVGHPPQPRTSPALTRDEMSRIAETYKGAAATPSDLGFEQQ